MRGGESRQLPSPWMSGGDAPLTYELEIRNLRKTYGDVLAVAGVSFSASPGEVIALLGPSGCGKTTTLRCVAGLENPTGGSIRIRDQEVWSEDGRGVRPEHREIGLVFQSYALWPHMTVFENVAYPLRTRRLPKGEVDTRVKQVLGMVGLVEKAGSYPGQLSGGQQQRVALARSVAMAPRIMLFDEPLSNLDRQLRDEMRHELRRLVDKLEITSVYVTHDQQEAFAIADRVAVMNRGVIEQMAPPIEIYAHPATSFIARFVGQVNEFRGVVERHGATDVVRLNAGNVRLPIASQNVADGTELLVMIRPEAISLTRPDSEGAADRPGALTLEVTEVDFLGGTTRVGGKADGLFLRIDAPSAVIYQEFGPEGIRPGDRIVALAHPESVLAFPRDCAEVGQET